MIVLLEAPPRGKGKLLALAARLEITPSLGQLSAPTAVSADTTKRLEPPSRTVPLVHLASMPRAQALALAWYVDLGMRLGHRLVEVLAPCVKGAKFPDHKKVQRFALPAVLDTA